MPLNGKKRKDLLPRGFAARIARETKKSEGHVSQVIAGYRPDDEIEDLVCEELECSRDFGFPEYRNTRRRLARK